MSLSYALHQNKVSKKKNAYRALIKNRRKYTLEDIINRMAESHGGITKSEAMGSLELFMSEVEMILIRRCGIYSSISCSMQHIGGV